jgi:hypothetical protein
MIRSRVGINLRLEDPESFGQVEIWNWLVLLFVGVPVKFHLDKPSGCVHHIFKAVENSRAPSCLRC